MTRLEVVPQSGYTPEDAAIWLHVCPALRPALTWARYSDQRDADAMYRWEKDRASGCPTWPYPAARIAKTRWLYASLMGRAFI